MSSQCSKIQRKEENWTSLISLIFEKINKIQKKTLKTHRRQWRNSENRNSIGFTDKSTFFFFKNWHDDFWENFARNQTIFDKNR
jgi:hypothetical protein